MRAPSCVHPCPVGCRHSRHHVRGVFNLEVPGEHGYCGAVHGLRHSGFSYNAEDFMAADSCVTMNQRKPRGSMGLGANCGALARDTRTHYSKLSVPLVCLFRTVCVFHFGWREGTCPDLNLMLSLVCTMASITSTGHAVALHGHSCKGRVALAAACYFVLERGLTYLDAIAQTQQHRWV